MPSHSPPVQVKGGCGWVDANGRLPNPFAAGPEGPDGHNELLIFRTQLEEVVPEPGTIVMLASVGLMGLIAFARFRRRQPT